jgi:hypothetical protein
MMGNPAHGALLDPRNLNSEYADVLMPFWIVASMPLPAQVSGTDVAPAIIVDAASTAFPQQALATAIAGRLIAHRVVSLLCNTSAGMGGKADFWQAIRAGVFMSSRPN